MFHDHKARQLRPGLDLAGLEALAGEMRSQGQLGLRVEKPRLAVPSLDFLEHFNHLEHLVVSGHARGLSVIARLPRLRRLAVGELSTKDLSFLQALPELEELWLSALRLQDWSSLRELKRLKSLTLFSMQQDDFSFLAGMEGLQFLRMRFCSGLRSLPSLRGLSRLRRVFLDYANRLEDLTGLAEAPNLEEVIVYEAARLAPEAFDGLVAHPKVKGILPGIAQTDSRKWRELVARIPSERFLAGPYETGYEGFRFVES